MTTTLQPRGLLCFVSLLWCLESAQSGNWPAWRGPKGNGEALQENPPLRWSTTDNVRWRTPLSEPGNSTPVVWGNRVFVSEGSKKEGRRSLLCFDRSSGELLWRKGAVFKSQELTHDTNPYGSSSPVTDGERVIVWFGSAGLLCFDFNGKELWRRDLGVQKHIWGWGASPVIHGERCFLNFGPGEPSFLLAVEKRTGKEVWKVAEPNADSGEKKPGQEKAIWTGSWSTPLLIQSAEREELILSWPKRVIAFEPTTGKELWSCAGLNPLVYTSPLYDEQSGVIVAMGGFAGMSLATKTGGTGDVTATHRLWHHPRTKQRIGSGIISGKHIYILNDPGVAECFELTTGKLVWEERLKGPAPKSDNWSSMVLSGDRIYAVNQGGDSFVLKASPHFKVLATNSLAEPTIASIAVSNHELFIRTHRNLWCIGEKRK